MKTVAYSLLSLFSLFLVSCGSSSGVDPHLSLEEQQEATEINLVGKWKIRRPQPIGTSNKFVFPADCNIDEIEFFDHGDYILAVSILDSEGEETSKIFRGKYDLLFIEMELIFFRKNCLNGAKLCIKQQFSYCGKYRYH